MNTGLARIAEKAKADRKLRFTSLAHLLLPSRQVDGVVIRLDDARRVAAEGAPWDGHRVVDAVRTGAMAIVGVT